MSDAEQEEKPMERVEEEEKPVEKPVKNETKLPAPMNMTLEPREPPMWLMLAGGLIGSFVGRSIVQYLYQ